MVNMAEASPRPNVGTECLRPRRRLLIAREQRSALHPHFEGQSLTDFNLREQHVHGIGRSQAKFAKDSFGALEAPGWNARADDRGWLAHAGNVPGRPA